MFLQLLDEAERVVGVRQRTDRPTNRTYGQVTTLRR